MIDFSRIEGFIFDNDGVIVNSEPLSCGALRELFIREFDVDIGTNFDTVIGSSDRYSFKYYIDKYNIQEVLDLDTLIKRKAEIYYNLAEGKLETFPGFHNLLQFLGKHYDLAVASSGNHEKIKFSLEQVDALKYFPIICSATEVEHGKPAPDLFEFTAECMGLNVEQCVVIEDSIKGVKGAKNAGMSVIGFTSSFDRETLKNAGADLIISSFADLQTKINSNR